MKSRTNGNDRNGTTKPVHRITRGKVEAALWRREGRQGVFYQVSFSRPYQTKDGSFASSENFALGQLADVAYAAVAAGLWMEAQRQPRSRNGDYGQEGTEHEFDAESGDAEFETY